MDIGYINFGREEKENLYKVLQSIRDHHAIDELGIGRIRDAFSNKMFPGMSTLHNRAKYFAVLPALYYTAERGHYKNVGEVRQRIINLEIKLTRQLMNGSPHEEQWGITGSTMIDQAERSPSRYVKYDPSYIYLGGLITYGMVKTNGNIYQLIFERSQNTENYPKRLLKQKEEENEADADELTGNRQLFDTGGLAYDFDGKTGISIALNKVEATYIKKKIITSENSKDSLLAYLLKHDIPIVKEYQELHKVWNELPEVHRLTYVLSARFSRFIYLLRIFYNYLYAQKTGNSEGANEQQDAYFNYVNIHKDDFNVEHMAEILKYMDADVNDMSVKRFCMETMKCVESNDLKALGILIEKREKEMKGATRAKLTNWSKYQGKPHVDAFFLNYRWNLVYSMINEIKKGLNHGQ